MDVRFDTLNTDDQPNNNSIVLDMNVSNKINFIEIDKVIDILSKARVDRKRSLYQTTSLNTIFNLCFFGVALYLLIKGSMNAADYKNVSAELSTLYDKKSNLQTRTFRNWFFKRTNNSITCDEIYPSVHLFNVCPPPLSVTLEICKFIIVSYCQNRTEFQTTEDELNASLPNLPLTLAFIMCGIFFIMASTCIFYQKTFQDIVNKARQEPTSHPYIPDIHKEYINEIANFLAIKIDPSIPIAKIIQEFKDRQEAREKRLAFFSGSVGESNKNTPLFRFFSIDGDRRLTYKILDYVDPILPYRNAQSKNPTKPEADPIVESNELTPLLGH